MAGGDTLGVLERSSLFLGDDSCLEFDEFLNDFATKKKKDFWKVYSRTEYKFGQ